MKWYKYIYQLINLIILYIIWYIIYDKLYIYNKINKCINNVLVKDEKLNKNKNKIKK